jgi:thymidylate synthase (FAD)
MRHDHTTPFEQVEFKFVMKLPIFVARQIVRHRTASINEVSARYSVVSDEFYIPQSEQIRMQSTTNKQGSSTEKIKPEIADTSSTILHNGVIDSYLEYTEMVNKGVSREIARVHLPVSLYTTWYWKIDLHNLLHFLQLRMDTHAQSETRIYANALAQIVKDVVPDTWSAFEEYKLNAITLSATEIESIRKGISDKRISDFDFAQDGGKRNEFEEKLGKFGIEK